MKDNKYNKSYEKFFDKIEPIFNIVAFSITGAYYILFSCIAIYYTVGYMSISSSFIFKLAISCITSFFLAILALGATKLYKGISFLTTKKNKRVKRIVKIINSKIYSIMALAMFSFMACVLSGFTISVLKDNKEFNLTIIIVFTILWICLIASFITVFLKKDNKEAKNDTKE